MFTGKNKIEIKKKYKSISVDKNFKFNYNFLHESDSCKPIMKDTYI